MLLSESENPCGSENMSCSRSNANKHRLGRFLVYSDVVGEGAYGKVFFAFDPITKNDVAIKVINGVGESDCDHVKKIRTFREIYLGRKLNHENVIKQLGVFSPRNGSVCIVMEKMETDLSKILLSSQQLSRDHTKYFVFQVLKGLFAMHSKKMIHRDIKPDNLLVNGNCKLKVADLGLCVADQNLGFVPLSLPVCTLWYRPPELCLNLRCYDEAVDIWGVGCVLGELLIRENRETQFWKNYVENIKQKNQGVENVPLFFSRDWKELLLTIFSLRGIPSDEEMRFLPSKLFVKSGCFKTSPTMKPYVTSLPYSKNFKKVPLTKLFPKSDPLAVELLDKLLQLGPQLRPTAETALRHPYFQDMFEENDLNVDRKKIDTRFEKSYRSVKERGSEYEVNKAASKLLWKQVLLTSIPRRYRNVVLRSFENLTM